MLCIFFSKCQWFGQVTLSNKFSNMNFISNAMRATTMRASSKSVIMQV